MPTHILVNNLGLTFKGTVGISTATLPDVCKTPSPGGPVPIPYPNVADQSSLSKGSKTVKAKGKMIAVKGSEYSMSMGDEPGTIGGVKSNTFKKETSWISYSFDVKIEGKNACRHTDKKFHNHQNTVDLAGNIDPSMAAALGDDVAEELCENLCACCENPGPDNYQTCLSKKYTQGGKDPYYDNTPNNSEMLPEVTTVTREGGGKSSAVVGIFKSGSGRKMPNGCLAPRSVCSSMGMAKNFAAQHTTRWDFVQLADPKKALSTSNIKNYVEVKFPRDTLTDNQQLVRKKMTKAERAKVVEVDVDKCDCSPTAACR